MCILEARVRKYSEHGIHMYCRQEATTVLESNEVAEHLAPQVGIWLQHCNCLPWRKPRHVVESKSRYYYKANNQPNKKSSFSTHMAVRTHSEYIAIISLSDYVAICLLGARMLFLLCFLEGMTLT